jgi:tRNA1(Val) A37 N6-methylase TrmN6
VKKSKTEEAARIAKANPQLHEQVKAGEIAHAQAKRQVARDQKRSDLATKAAQAAQVLSEQPQWGIIAGDCLAVMENLDPFVTWGRTDVHRPRLIVADPPYNIGMKYGKHYHDRQPRAEYLEWTERWITGAADLLLSDGSLWVLINHEHAADVELMLRAAGLTIRSWITWYETFRTSITRADQGPG